MRLILQHAFTARQIVLHWHRGAGLLAAMLLIWSHLGLIVLADIRVFWVPIWNPDGPPNIPGLYPLGIVLVAALFGILHNLVPDQDPSEWVPHPGLPLTARGRAIGEALGLAAVWLAGGLLTIWILAFMAGSADWGGAYTGLQFLEDSAGFVESCALLLPLFILVATHVYQGQVGMGLLMGSLVAAVEMLADRIGLLAETLPAAVVSVVLLATVILLGPRPRPRSREARDLYRELFEDEHQEREWVVGDVILDQPIGSSGEASGRGNGEEAFRAIITLPGYGAESPSGGPRRRRKRRPMSVTVLPGAMDHYRPAMEPRTRLRLDFREFTLQCLKVLGGVAIVTYLGTLALSYTERVREWGFLLIVPAIIVTGAIAVGRTQAWGFPMEVTGARPGGREGSGFSRACGMLPLPLSAVGRALCAETATLTLVISAAILAGAPLATLRGSPTIARLLLATALAIFILTPAICGGVIASALGGLKERGIVGFTLVLVGIVMIIMVASVTAGGGGWPIYGLLAAPVSVLGGLWPVLQYLQVPSPEVTHGKT